MRRFDATDLGQILQHLRVRADRSSEAYPALRSGINRMTILVKHRANIGAAVGKLRSALLAFAVLLLPNVVRGAALPPPSTSTANATVTNTNRVLRSEEHTSELQSPYV